MRRIILAAVAATLCLSPAIAKPGHPTSWTFSTVDVPKNSNTVLTGINNLKKVTGYAFNGAIDGAVEAVTAEAPYASFFNISFPGSTHSVAAGLSNTQLQVGHYASKSGTFAYARDHGKYTSYGSRGTEFFGENNVLCPNAGTHCHGQDKGSDRLAVGFETVDGAFRAIEYDITAKVVAHLKPPGAKSAIATGINGKGKIVGEMTTSSGVAESWALIKGQYYEFAFPGATRTTALSINWQDDIAGAYVDSAGNRHGFVYYFQPIGSCKVGSTCYTVDAPNAVGASIIYGINDQDELVGSYAEGSGAWHGFFAAPNL